MAHTEHSAAICAACWWLAVYLCWCALCSWSWSHSKAWRQVSLAAWLSTFLIVPKPKSMCRFYI